MKVINHKSSKDREMIIQPRRSNFSLNLREVWDYRELLWTLTYRDFRIKYAQTLIGFSWAVINPVFTILILSFVFGNIAKVGTGSSDVPHILFTTVGICGWAYFSSLLGQAGGSIIGAQNMVKKIYFPRLIIPLSKAITSFVDLGVVLFCIFILMLWYGISPGKQLVYLPFYLIAAVICGLAGGIWMSALTVRFRDFTHITPLLLRLGMYATPIAYPSSSVPEKYQILFFLNPMAGVIEGVRWSILGGDQPSSYMYISFIVVLVLLIFGVFYFNKIQTKMADII